MAHCARRARRPGARTPEFLIVDGAAGLEKALAALWATAHTQRCTAHKHRNLLAHAPKRLHEERWPVPLDVPSGFATLRTGKTGAAARACDTRNFAPVLCAAKV